MTSLLTCKDFLVWLNEYLDDTAGEAIRQEVEKHINGCPNCFVIFDTTRKTIQIYKGMEARELPESVHTRLMQALERRIASQSIGELLLFHTAPANIPLLESLLAELAPGIRYRHVTEPEHLEQAVAAGGMTPEITAQVQRALARAVTPQTRMVVCTCSTIGGAAEQASLAVPVVRIDAAMAEEAVRLGSRILVAACLESTVAPTTDLIRQTALRLGRPVEVEVLLIRHAWPKFQAGDKEGYWNDIASELLKRGPGFSAVVLSQASMAGAVEKCSGLGVPVLASPRLGVGEIVRRWRDLPATASSPLQM
jgi:anti-sigma factor RsiW